jgi:dTDP-4-amino-4,6-dideoxygalactose transaminase
VASDFEIAEKISNNGFMLGCHQDFSLEQIDTLISAISELAKTSRRS